MIKGERRITKKILLLAFLSMILISTMPSVALEVGIGWKQEFWVQGYHPDCGVACVSMILKWASYPGEMPNSTEIRNAGGTEEGDEMTNHEMKKALEEYGVECRQYATNNPDVAKDKLKESIEGGCPNIIGEQVNGGTWEVVYGYNDTGVLLCRPGAADADEGHTFKDWETLEEKWSDPDTGYYLRLEVITPQCALSRVGGVWGPVNKFALLAPYIGLTTAILVATVATAIYVKRVERREEKQ